MKDIQNACPLGRSEVRDAKTHERDVCGRARVDERRVFYVRDVRHLTHPPPVEQAFAQVVRRRAERCRSDAGGRFQHPLTDV